MRLNDKRSAGYSLIEIVVSLTILSLFLALFFGSFLQFSRSVRRQQDVSSLMRETDAAFMRLDRQLSGAFGWINGDSLGITLIEHNGDSLDVYWNPGDSMLYQKNAALYPQGVKVEFCRFYFMPKMADAMAIKPELWVREVDLDGNGVIEGLELKNTLLLQIKIKTVRNKAEYETINSFKLPSAIVDIRFMH